MSDEKTSQESLPLISKEVNLWGNAEWKVQIESDAEFSRFRIRYSNKTIQKEITEDAKNLFELAQSIRKFANSHDITIFDRRIASFLYDLLATLGARFSQDHILKQIKEPPILSDKERKLKELEKYVSERFKLGRLVHLSGSVRWKIQIGMEKGLQDPMRVIFQDEELQRKEEFEVKNLNELVQLIKQKIEDLNIPIYDRRLAQWISNYFEIELNVPLRFSEALKIIKQKIDLSQLPELGIKEETTTIPIDKDKAKDMLPSIESDVGIRLKSLKIKHMEDEEQLLTILTTILDAHKDEENTIVTRQISATTRTGKPLELKPRQLPTQPAEDPNHRTLTATFENTFNEELFDVELSDILPYDLKVDHVELNVPVEMEKHLLDEGLKITWKIPELKPKQAVEIKYITSRRINRSIVLHAKDEVFVINTNFSIHIKDPPILHLYGADTDFIGIEDQIFEHVLITDFIPQEFDVNRVEVNPSDFEREILKIENGLEYRWKKATLQQGDVLQWKYDLVPKPFITLHQGKIPLVTTIEKTDDVHQLLYALLYQPLPGRRDFLMTFLAETQHDHPIKTMFELELPATSSVQQFILPEEVQLTNFFWELNPHPFKKANTLQMSFKFEANERIAVAFHFKSEKDIFDPFLPLAITINDKEMHLKVPKFSKRLLQFIPLPKEHVKLLERMKNLNTLG